MHFTFEDITRANEGLTSIDFKGKSYVMVTARVTAFRKLIPDGFIKTDLLSIENGVCVMKASAGYYTEDGREIVLGTGMAYEKESSSYINKTSYIENCETSAVGRALGFLALGSDDSIASAEELVNAITNQDKPQQKKSNKGGEQRQFSSTPGNASVTTSTTVPAAEEPETAESYRKKAWAQYGADYNDPKGEKLQQFRQALVDGGLIEDKPLKEMDLNQIKAFFRLVYEQFADLREAS